MSKNGNDFALGTSLNLVNQDRICHYWEGGLTNTATDTVHAYSVCGQAEQIIDTLLCWFKPWWSRNSVWGHDLSHSDLVNSTVLCAPVTKLCKESTVCGELGDCMYVLALFSYYCFAFLSAFCEVADY